MSNNLRKLPTIQDLHDENPDAFKQDQFKALVNQQAPEKWVKKHPMSGNAYMPVEKVEYLLDAIIGQWKLEILAITPMFQSIVATIRLHYFNPATLSWEFHDGAGASPIQTDKGASPADLASIKSNALQLAVPAAISYALKDAAEHIGIIFGRNVSRRDTLQYKQVFDKDPYNGEQATVIDAPIAQSAPVQVVQIDTTPPKFEEDFFAPPAGNGTTETKTTNQEIDF